MVRGSHPGFPHNLLQRDALLTTDAWAPVKSHRLARLPAASKTASTQELDQSRQSMLHDPFAWEREIVQVLAFGTEQARSHSQGKMNWAN